VPLEKMSIRPALVSLVTEIQGATGWTVDAIRLIGRAIGGVDEKMTAIAATVEEHCPATTEISRNFQEAAQGTRAVTDTIGNVAGLNRDTKSSSTGSGSRRGQFVHLYRRYCTGVTANTSWVSVGGRNEF
jgi:methyl-accepting chemotaxis protein